MSNVNFCQCVLYKSKVDAVHAALTDWDEISSRHATVDKNLLSAISWLAQPITLVMKIIDLLLNGTIANPRQPKWAASWQYQMSRLMTKPTKWHVHPVKTQISLGIRPVWSESSLCAQWVAMDPSFLHADSEDSDQTGRMPRLIWVFAGHTVILLVLSWGGSNQKWVFWPLSSSPKERTFWVLNKIVSVKLLFKNKKTQYKLTYKWQDHHHHIHFRALFSSTEGWAKKPSFCSELWFRINKNVC